MTKAKMIVKNQTNSDIETNWSDANCVLGLNGFKNLKIGAYKSSDWVDLETEPTFGCLNVQSHFQINYLNGGIGTNIGLVKFDTNVTSNSKPDRIQAVLAPNRPIVDSFKFYFYGGPGVVTPLVNSVINANLNALTKAISQNPLADGIISSFNFSSFSCLYAAAVPARTNVLDFSVILKVSGSVSGKLGLVLSVTDMIILIEGNIDLSSDKPKISATLFKCSLGSYQIPIEVFLALLPFIALIPVIGVPLAALAGALIATLKLVGTPIALAGSINDTDLNKTILEAINKAFQNV